MTRYQIVVRGELSDRFASAFPGLSAERRDGLTVLVGDLEDQARLFGLLEQVRDFALELVRVEQVP